VTRVLERGDISFLYRPRVEEEVVQGLEDVQRFFVVLKPEGQELFRRIVVGRKRLPEPEEHERLWAFVDQVAREPREVREELERTEYETQTQGERVQPEARPAGEGRYALAEHDGHTPLAYALELPRRPGQPQEELRIEEEASYVVAVKNPDVTPPPGVGLRSARRASFPSQLAERFRGRRFIPVDPPDFLDHEGAELVLIGAAEDASAELGIEFDAQREQLATADVFGRLRLRPEEHPTEPLEKGEWR
jgi:hypothetical protein